MPINVGGRLRLIHSKVKQGFLPQILKFANNRSIGAIRIHDKIQRK